MNKVKNNGKNLNKNNKLEVSVNTETVSETAETVKVEEPVVQAVTGSMTLKVKKLHPSAIIPTRGSAKASGLDLYSLQDVEIKVGETKLVRTGVAFQIPEGYEIQVRPRSGLTLKSGLIVKNSPGTVDQDYTGECAVIMHNLFGDTSSPVHKISRGERIAQAVLCPVIILDTEEVESFDISTDRGEKGFGSSGK